MQANSSLSLKNYIVKKMSFSINEYFDFTQNTAIRINPEFTRNITKIDDDNVTVNLIFCIDNVNGDMPFSMEIDIEGLFHLENWEHPDLITIIKSNAVAILFPYLRTIVSMITANANISPYMLPVMNIAAMFNHKMEAESLD